MPQWFERTDLNLLLDLDGLTEKRLLNALDALEAPDAEKLQQTIFAAVQQRYHLPVSGVIYDVTNYLPLRQEVSLSQIRARQGRRQRAAPHPDWARGHNTASHCSIRSLPATFMTPGPSMISFPVSSTTRGERA